MTFYDAYLISDQTRLFFTTENKGESVSFRSIHTNHPELTVAEPVENAFKKSAMVNICRHLCITNMRI